MLRDYECHFHNDDQCILHPCGEDISLYVNCLEDLYHCLSSHGLYQWDESIGGHDHTFHFKLLAKQWGVLSSRLSADLIIGLGSLSISYLILLGVDRLVAITKSLSTDYDLKASLSCSNHAFSCKRTVLSVTARSAYREITYSISEARIQD